MRSWKQLNLNMPVHIHSKLKMLSVIENKPMRDLIIEMIERRAEQFENQKNYANLFKEIDIQKGEEEDQKAAENREKDDQIYDFIFGLRNAGVSYMDIAEDLNRNNMPTLSGKGKWHAQTVHNYVKYKILKEK